MRSGLRLPERILRGLVEHAQVRDWLRRLNVNCVIDVGANVGQFAYLLRRLGYDKRIISFEPHPGAFSTLTARFGEDRQWRGWPYALGPRDGASTFMLNESSDLSSFLPGRNANWHVTPIQVEMRRLDTIFDNLVEGINEPRVFLKMDTQGYDLNVLAGATGSINHVVLLQSEISVFSLYEGMKPYYDSLQEFSRLGFSLADLALVTRTRERLVLEYDALLVRTDTHV